MYGGNDGSIIIYSGKSVKTTQKTSVVVRKKLAKNYFHVSLPLLFRFWFVKIS